MDGTPSRTHLISEMVRHNAATTCKLPCDFDEFSHDTLHNQILKATFRRLIRWSSLAKENLSKENTEGLAHLCRLFTDIRDIELNSRIFGQVQLHRNKQFYDFLLKVCELIYCNLLISEATGDSKFADFLRDEKQMAVLFENFIRNFYKHKKPDYRVKKECLEWLWTAADQHAQSLLPRMEPDISLVRGMRKIIIDCKYYPDAMQIHYQGDKEKLRSAHLYQINSYMTNLPVEDATSAKCEMMLLYPTVSSPLSAKYEHEGHKISIQMINLNQRWQKIESDLLALVD